MDEHYRRQFGSAIRAAEGRPDEDGTLPARRDPRTGRWGIAEPPRSGNGIILATVFICVAAVVWMAIR